MKLEIITYPDPRLNQKCQKATIDDKLRELVQNMMDTMNSFKEPEAAGLSAIQVGVPVRVLIARNFSLPTDSKSQSPQDSKDSEKVNQRTYQDIIMINPKLISASKEEELDWEGCLSFPDLYGKVWRAKKIKLKYQDLEGTQKRLTASGFLARVIQHELDHLDGITFNTKIVGKMYKGEELDKNTKVAN